MVINQAPCLIMKVIADYKYIYNVIDHNKDYIAFGITFTRDHVIDYKRLRLPIAFTLTLMHTCAVVYG